MGYSQVAKSQPASPLAAKAPASAKEAYTLPPEKPAKAIAFSRVWHILALVGTLWGLAVPWILLEIRARSGARGPNTHARHVHPVKG